MKHSSKNTVVTVRVIDESTRVRGDRRMSRRMGPIEKMKMTFARVFGNDGAVYERRDVPIMSYVGHNGHGKTQCMVLDTIPTLLGIEWDCKNPDHKHTQRGITHGVRRVLSTVKLLDPTTGEPHPLYDPFDSWDRLTDFEHGDLLMDEMTGIAHSRQSSTLPPAMQLLLNQFRKADIAVRWTAPDWDRADKLVRETTQGVTLCRGTMPVKQGTALWKSNRRFRFETFDAKDFNEFNANARDKLTHLTKQWFWAPEHQVRDYYDTQQSVIMLAHATDSGICVGCGGTRRRHECSCADYQERVEARKSSRTSAPSRGDSPVLEHAHGH